MVSKALRDLSINLNQPLKLADARYVGIIKTDLETYKYADCFPFYLALIFPVT
jgi:hypothetical protein